jgi:hypothetical protein
MSITVAVLLAVAAARLAHLVVVDSVTEPVRQWVWRRWPRPAWLLNSFELPGHRWPFGPIHPSWEIIGPDGHVPGTDAVHPDLAGRWISADGSWFGRLLLCAPWCVSVWTSAAIVATWTVAVEPAWTGGAALRAVVLWWAVAGIAVPVTHGFGVLADPDRAPLADSLRTWLQRAGDAALIRSKQDRGQ